MSDRTFRGIDGKTHKPSDPDYWQAKTTASRKNAADAAFRRKERSRQRPIARNS